MRRLMIPVLVVMLVVVGGCDVVDPARPTAQPDAVVFGNLLVLGFAIAILVR